jgi:Protein of unknown function (DUF1559)/Domain of unknown function (DUF4190)
MSNQDQPSPPVTSGKAIVSLVFGILSFCLPCVGSLLAILFGALALSEIGRAGARLGGKGIAITGLVLGVITTIIFIPALLIALLLPAVQQVRQAAERTQTMNNYKQACLGILNYENSLNCLPPAAITNDAGKPLLSWRVAILPYIELERADLYQQFHLDEPWDSPHNLKLLDQMPMIYRDLDNPGGHETRMQMFTGPRTLNAIRNGNNCGMKLPQITAGASNTIMLIEANQLVPWTKPADVEIGNNQPLPMFGKGFGRLCVAMCDGSVRLIEPSAMPEQTWRLAIDPTNNVPFQFPD